MSSSELSHDEIKKAEYVAALKVEKAGYVQQQKDDRAELVQAEIDRVQGNTHPSRVPAGAQHRGPQATAHNTQTRA